MKLIKFVKEDALLGRPTFTRTGLLVTNIVYTGKGMAAERLTGILQDELVFWYLDGSRDNHFENDLDLFHNDEYWLAPFIVPRTMLCWDLSEDTAIEAVVFADLSKCYEYEGFYPFRVIAKDGTVKAGYKHVKEKPILEEADLAITVKVTLNGEAVSPELISEETWMSLRK